MVLCLAALVAWVQSYRAGWTVSVIRDRGDFHLLIDSVPGEIRIGETHSSMKWDIAYWKLCILLLVVPARWGQQMVVPLTRPRAGHCSVCGYDLRATPHRCPECGSVPGQAAPLAQRWKATLLRSILLLTVAHAIGSYATFGFLLVSALRAHDFPLSDLPQIGMYWVCSPIWPMRLDIYWGDSVERQFYACVMAISVLLLRSRIVGRSTGVARTNAGFAT
jgi:hypothetical protein